jgi:hypothetical protein
MTAEANAAELLKIWRDKKFPFFHIKHCSFNPNSPLNEGNEGNGFKDIVAPIDGEPTIRKNVSSDATATFNNKGLDGQNYSAELMHGTSLASLNEEFATIVTTDDLKQNILTSDD